MYSSGYIIAHLRCLISNLLGISRSLPGFPSGSLHLYPLSSFSDFLRTFTSRYNIFYRCPYHPSCPVFISFTKLYLTFFLIPFNVQCDNENWRHSFGAIVWECFGSTEIIAKKYCCINNKSGNDAFQCNLPH